ncbi:MAG TPA: hypothetical protein VEX38_02380, partial [Fimbriimonadaceae bacterium]|nr:hypothetical protein [Fimbriimonadaceae bacterium]
LDRLMWTIAEESQVKAADEFGQRFPELRTELYKRMDAVKSLKEAKGMGAAHPGIPQFHPRLAEPPARFAKPLVALLLGATLFALAIGSYLLTSVVLPKPQEPKANPDTVIRTDAGGNPGIPEFHKDGVTPVPFTGKRANNSGSGASTGEPTVRRYSLRLQDAPLSTALEAIATVAGLKLEIAPNTPDPEISIEYNHMTGMEMLKDLGRKHGFTPLDQGESKVLIVPAVDPNFRFEGDGG